MSTLLDRTRTPGRAARPPAGGGSPWLTGVLVAGQAAAASLSVILVPVVLAWATASFSSAPWGQALQVGVGVWLLAHHAAIVIPGGHVGLVPLGLMLIPVFCCWLAGVRLGRNLDPHADDLRDGVGRAKPVLPPLHALVCLVGTYSAAVTIASILATSGPVRPLAAQAFVGAVVISTVSSVCGAAAWARGGFVPGLQLVLAWCRPPAWLRRVLPAVGAALVLQLVAGLLLLLVAVGLGWGRVTMLHGALEPGLAGGLVLLLAQLAVIPNLVVWAVPITAGPGFVIGSGTAVHAGETTLGVLPAVPLLGALPPDGPHPIWLWGLLAVPLLAGGLLGWLVQRRHAEDADVPEVLPVLADVGRAAVVLGLLWAVLGWLSAGPAGPGSLAHAGPVGWQLGLAVLIESGASALLVAGTMLGMRRLVSWHEHQPQHGADATSPSD
jgi:Family of unknown function (DUF6350)